MSDRNGPRMWAGFLRIERHRRLNIAVLGCLAVMFALAAGLVGVIRHLDASSSRALSDTSVDHEMAGLLHDTAIDVASLVAGVEGAEQALADHRDALARGRDELDPIVHQVEIEELDGVLGDLAVLLDGSGPSSPADLSEIVVRLDAVGERFVSRAAVEASGLGGMLDGWFLWIQVVAFAASIVFLIVVVTAILPLSRSIQRSLVKLTSWQDWASRDTARRTLAAQVADGLDIADDESTVFEVISRAMEVAAPDQKVELLLADSSNAHLRPRVVHPTRGRAGCDAPSPWACPAVRRGTTMSFDDSGAIRSCPHLADHDTPCSAVCSPLTFMGEPMGVLHAAGPVGETPSKELIEDLAMVAGEAATRLGTLRAFARAELQANTDPLTGLPNRRATEDRLRAMLEDANGGALAMVEFDGLAKLNEDRGREVADRALAAAADALRGASRDDDFVGRWAGAGFVIALPGLSLGEAKLVVGRMRAAVEMAFVDAGTPEVGVKTALADTLGAESVGELLDATTSNAKRAGATEPAAAEA